MFNSNAGVLIFSTVLALIIIGSIVEGYVLHDQIVMTVENWKGVIAGRLSLHLIGILPFWIFSGYLMESFWKAALLCVLNLAVMNYYPIMDLVYGPLVVEQPSPEKWYREEYNNPSSDVDFSTHKVPMIGIYQGDRSMMLTEERWNEVHDNCNGQIPVRFTGLQHLEVELEWKCD